MEQLEERLAHQVRRHQRLYDVTDKDHKNHEGTARSWREVGSTLEEDPERCREEWKRLRDKFVRLKKRMKTKSRDPGSAYCIMVSWLEGFIKNWETQVAFNGVAAEGLLAFEEVAVRFTDEEWTLLDAGQRALYQEVMAENYGMVASLVQELQAEINAEDQPAGAAASSKQETGDGEGRSRLLFQLPIESEAKSWRRLERIPAAGPKQECRCSWRTMGFSSPSLEFNMREFQKVWKTGAGEEDALRTRISFSGERPLGFADSADVKEELAPEEESLNGETQGRLEEKLRRPLADINSSTPMQETSGRVKILHWMETSPEGVFLGKAYLGPGLGPGNSTLDSKDGFWLEKPKEANHHGTLLERALGKLIAGPDTQEGLETKQEVDSLMEVKHDLALFREEAPTDGSTRTHQGKDASFDRSRNRQQRAGCSENRIEPMESERIYKCSYCGRCFEKSFDLVTHERAHIGEKIYRCFHCEKRFSHRIDLLTHKRNHPGEKPHQCELDCAKCHGQTTFPRPPHRAPPGEKPCQCPVCGERFRWKSNLIRHRRIHTGEKPYRCADCGKSYTRKTALDRHKRTHVREKVCEIGAPSLGPTSVLVLLV